MIRIGYILNIMVAVVCTAMISGCLHDEPKREMIFVDEPYEVESIPLFAKEDCKQTLPAKGGSVSISYTYNDPETGLYLISSQDVKASQHYEVRSVEGEPFAYVKGDSYNIPLEKEEYTPEDLVTDLLLKELRLNKRPLNDKDLSSTGTTIISTRPNTTFPFDKCEFIYGGWLTVILDGNNSSDKWMILRASENAGTEARCANIYFSLKGRCVNNLIQVVQPAAQAPETEPQ